MKNIGKSGRICNDPEKKEILRSWRVGLLPKSCLEVKSDRRPWETELPVFPVMGVGWGGGLQGTVRCHQHSPWVEP